MATVSLLWGECNGLLRHDNLVLRTLAAKCASLSNMLAGLQVESGDYFERFSKAASLPFSLLVVRKDGDNVVERARVKIVRRWFAAYVQLHDRFVLLESGK
jgi:hypothetical protein